MGLGERRGILEQIEKARGSRVLTYVTGDRAPTPAQIGDDAVRPIYDHLRAFGRIPKLDFFIYSRGGAIDVPWRIITALRTAAEEWSVLIPFRANSAATLLALGADRIILGKQGELGPIDPIIAVQRMLQVAPGQPPTRFQEQLNVEDIMAYVRFIYDRGGLSDQTAITEALGKLVDRVDSVTLGSAYRTHTHIRDLARRVLSARKSPPSEQAAKTIIETLAERVYAHGHAIGFNEAKEIGLPVEQADDTLGSMLWALLNEYESELKLLEPVDPAAVTVDTDLYTEPATIALVESTWGSHAYTGTISIRAQRQMPQNFNVALNLNLQVPQIPPGGAPGAPQGPPNQAVQQALQAILQQIQPLLLQQANQAVNEALRKQAPISGLEARFLGGRWHRLEDPQAGTKSPGATRLVPSGSTEGSSAAARDSISG